MGQTPKQIDACPIQPDSTPNKAPRVGAYGGCRVPPVNTAWMSWFLKTGQLKLIFSPLSHQTQEN